MQIIDSLFVGNSLFLFGSGVENPFSFCFSRKKRQLSSAKGKQWTEGPQGKVADDGYLRGVWRLIGRILA
jgi:hypothetical protein